MGWFVGRVLGFGWLGLLRCLGNGLLLVVHAGNAVLRTVPGCSSGVWWWWVLGIEGGGGV